MAAYRELCDQTHFLSFLHRNISECARDQFEYIKAELIGKLFNCEANGNYMKVQCAGSECYCVDMLGQRRGNSTVPISDMDNMSC